MSNAQMNMAAGDSPFLNWFSNPDGTKNMAHIFEAVLGAAAIGLIVISLINSD